jgi:hypothetical protein
LIDCRATRAARVVPEIVHVPGTLTGSACTVIDLASGAKRTLWVMIAVLGSVVICARVCGVTMATTLADPIDLRVGRLASPRQSEMLCAHRVVDRC